MNELEDLVREAMRIVGTRERLKKELDKVKQECSDTAIQIKGAMKESGIRSILIGRGTILYRANDDKLYLKQIGHTIPCIDIEPNLDDTIYADSGKDWFGFLD